MHNRRLRSCSVQHSMCYTHAKRYMHSGKHGTAGQPNMTSTKLEHVYICGLPTYTAYLYCLPNCHNEHAKQMPAGACTACSMPEAKSTQHEKQHGQMGLHDRCLCETYLHALHQDLQEVRMGGQVVLCIWALKQIGCTTQGHNSHLHAYHAILHCCSVSSELAS